MKSQEKQKIYKDHIDGLNKAKSVKNRHHFKSSINRILPDLSNYIARRLNIAHSTGLIDKRGVSPEEIIDMVYLKLYDNYDLFRGSFSDLETWTYQAVDEVLEDQLNEKAFERENLVYLQKLEDLELSGLEEKFTADAEGELIMIEDFDDVSYTRKLYDPVEFLEDRETLKSIESILSEFDKVQLHKEIQKYLLTLPEEERTIFDLFWIVGLPMNQIARIRNISIAETEEALKRAGAHIRKKLTWGK
jgi:RNA polymerase sigma factor (sigma-70 family)